MQQQARYTNLRDYLALLRRQRWVVLGITLVFGFAAYGLSAAQESRYTATASIAFRDVAEDLSLIGGQGLRELSPAERAARNAQLISGQQIAQVAKRKLKTDVSVDRLSDAVAPRVSVQTGLVDLEANWTDADFAADVANAFAEAAVARATRDERQRLEGGIDGLKDRLKEQDKDSLLGQLTLSQISQLQALAEIAEPAELTQRAEVPEAPESPQPTRNAILGLIVGLTFGLITAFARDALDRRIRTPHDAHDQLGYPVLGRIGQSAMGTAGLVSNGGSFVTTQDIESFRMLRTNLAFLSEDVAPRTVLVTSGLAQEGKSTVAAAVASASAAAGTRTLLVDGDLRRPVLAERLGVQPAPGLAEYLAGDAAPAEILQVRSVSANGAAPAQEEGASAGEQGFGADLVCIAAGSPRHEQAELLASDRCRDFLKKVGKAYDLVVIDSSPMLASVDPLNLIPHVDAVLLCVRVQASSRDEVRAIKQAMGRLPERPTGIVVTGLRRGSGGEYGYYGYDYTS